MIFTTHDDDDDDGDGDDGDGDDGDDGQDRNRFHHRRPPHISLANSPTPAARVDQRPKDCQ